MANRASWPEARRGLEARFRTQSRQAWTEVFQGLDACVTPVLTVDELAPQGLPTLPDVLGQPLTPDHDGPND